MKGYPKAAVNLYKKNSQKIVYLMIFRILFNVDAIGFRKHFHEYTSGFWSAEMWQCSLGAGKKYFEISQELWSKKQVKTIRGSAESRD